jgi:hypothetical protein
MVQKIAEKFRTWLGKHKMKTVMRERGGSSKRKRKEIDDEIFDEDVNVDSPAEEFQIQGVMVESEDTSDEEYDRFSNSPDRKHGCGSHRPATGGFKIADHDG